MADIKQAAKWLKQGKKVYQESMPSGHFVQMNPNDGFIDYLKYEGDRDIAEAVFQASDFLDKTWEIYEP